MFFFIDSVLILLFLLVVPYFKICFSLSFFLLRLEPRAPSKS